MSLAEVSRRTGLPLSTASRLISLLVDRGFVRRGPAGQGLVPGRWLEGVGIKALGGLKQSGRFDEHITRLASEVGESISVALLDFDRLLLIARRESPHPLRMVAAVGDLLPPLRTAAGKAVLAFLPENRQLALLAAAGEPNRSLGLLAGELEDARRLGYARDEEQFAVGLRCVAAPFFMAGGDPLGAISVGGPAARFTPELAAAAIEPLRLQVRAISEELGHQH